MKIQYILLDLDPVSYLELNLSNKSIQLIDHPLKESLEPQRASYNYLIQINSYKMYCVFMRFEYRALPNLVDPC